MIVGGNIDGFTRVMTTAIALETSKGDLPLALALGAGAAGGGAGAECADRAGGAAGAAARGEACRPWGRGRHERPGAAEIRRCALRRASPRCRGVDLTLARRRAAGPDRRQRQRQEHAAARAAWPGAAQRRVVLRDSAMRQAMVFQRPVHAARQRLVQCGARPVDARHAAGARPRTQALAALGRVGLAERGLRNARTLVGRAAAAAGAGARLEPAARRAVARRAHRQPGPACQARGGST